MSCCHTINKSLCTIKPTKELKNVFHANLLYGEQNKNVKKYLINQFCDTNSKTQILISTSAGNCGHNYTNCTAVIHYIFPLSLIDLVQKIGQAGRSEEIYKNLSVSAVEVITVELLNSAIILIDHQQNSERKKNIEHFKDLLFKIFLPTVCVHLLLEKEFEETSVNQYCFCKEACDNACCYYEPWWICPVSKEKIIDALQSIFIQIQNTIKSSELPKILYNNYQKLLWPKEYLKIVRTNRNCKIMDKQIRASAQWLVMALYLCNILSFNIVKEDNSKSKTINVSITKAKEAGQFMSIDERKWRQMGY